MSITYSECVFVAPSMQCTCTILSSVTCPAVLYFSTLSQKLHDFRKKKLLNMKCVSIFSTAFFLKLFSFLEEMSEICSKMCVGLHVKYRLFLSDFNESFSSTDFPKILKCLISWKFVQWELSCSIRTDRRTEIMKLIVAFHNFAKAPEVYIVKPVSRGTWAQRTLVCCGKHLISFSSLSYDRSKASSKASSPHKAF
jgi:hypothetical protein